MLSEFLEDGRDTRETALFHLHDWTETRCKMLLALKAQQVLPYVHISVTNQKCRKTESNCRDAWWAEVGCCRCPLFTQQKTPLLLFGRVLCVVAGCACLLFCQQWPLPCFSPSPPTSPAVLLTMEIRAKLS